MGGVVFLVSDFNFVFVGNEMNFNGGMFVWFLDLMFLILDLMFYGVMFLDMIYLMVIYMFEYDGFVDFL